MVDLPFGPRWNKSLLRITITLNIAGTMADCSERREQVLARSPCAEARQCGCGHVHLTIGPLTLRLDSASFRALCLTLMDALEEMQRREGEAVPSARA